MGIDEAIEAEAEAQAIYQQRCASTGTSDRMPGRMLADLEEGRFQAFVGQCLEHGGRVARPRAVVERSKRLPCRARSHIA